MSHSFIDAVRPHGREAAAWATVPRPPLIGITRVGEVAFAALWGDCPRPARRELSTPRHLLRTRVPRTPTTSAREDIRSFFARHKVTLPAGARP
jgi:hypothetical protein